MTTLNLCPICNRSDFNDASVLWPELIHAWQLNSIEVNYVNRQQGTYCLGCGNNLRTMALASAILNLHDYQSSFSDFCKSGIPLKILEINRAGNLTQFLQNMPGHYLVEYPDFDMQKLKLPDNSFDLVVHSDTLEHIPHTIRGLEECRRVLKPKGKCVFTVPVIVNRLNRSRDGLEPSYHGHPDTDESDQRVYTEFGADVWQTVIGAGFHSCTLYALEYPAALALIAEG